jgi:hypothetical protein
MSEDFFSGRQLLGTPDLSCGVNTQPIPLVTPLGTLSTSTGAGHCTKNVDTLNEFFGSYGPQASPYMGRLVSRGVSAGRHNGNYIGFRVGRRSIGHESNSEAVSVSEVRAHCMHGPFPSAYNLTYGRRSQRLHQNPACGGQGLGRARPFSFSAF